MNKRVLHPQWQNNVLIDITIDNGHGLPIALLGAGGPARELAAFDSVAMPPEALPVLLGSGMGHTLQAILQQTSSPVAVVDKEHDLLAHTHLQTAYSDTDRVFWIDDPDAISAATSLSRWQLAQHCRPLYPVALPAYLRLDPAYYGTLRKTLSTSKTYDFWGRAARPRFTQQSPRIALITSHYFLMGEIEDACQKLGVEYKTLYYPDKAIASDAFIKALLEIVITFQPDCLLTLNHLGIDREGVLIGLIEKLRLPLASWFLDNPHLILDCYERQHSPWLTIFTWDADNIPSLGAQGFEHAHYLPLGVNTVRFHPRNRQLSPPAWCCTASFVGNSMRHQTALRLKAGHFPRWILRSFATVARSFSLSTARSVYDFLAQQYPAEYHWLHSQSSIDRLTYARAVTWMATGLYRAQCVRALLPLHPRIIGDSGWKAEFRHDDHPPEIIPPIAYYRELPLLYAASTINLNTTSKQMKGAVNQRVFDVPASGAFVLTDWREQLDALMEVGKEIIVYKDPEEIIDLANYYLTHEQERNAIIAAGLQRVRQEHTWTCRLQSLLNIMRQTYGPAAL